MSKKEFNVLVLETHLELVYYVTHNARKKYTITLCERFEVLTFGILTCTTFLDITAYMTHNARKKYTITLCERFEVLTFGILTCTTFLDITAFFLYSNTTKNKKEFKMMTFMLSVCNYII